MHRLYSRITSLGGKKSYFKAQKDENIPPYDKKTVFRRYFNGEASSSGIRVLHDNRNGKINIPAKEFRKKIWKRK